MAPTSIDGSEITGATIDGQEVSEITADGDVVYVNETVYDSPNTSTTVTVDAGSTIELYGAGGSGGYGGNGSGSGGGNGGFAKIETSSTRTVITSR